MESKREELLKLDQEKKTIESEIADLIDYLTGEGMPGVEGSLVDSEGYPLPNLDLYAIRNARRTLIMKKNDLTTLMDKIESKMASYFEEVNKKKQSDSAFTDKRDKKEDDKEPIGVSLPDEDKKKEVNTSATKEPFALISEVTEGSPAEEAGLKQGDAITSFDVILTKGKSPNPLQAIAMICRDKTNEKIPVTVIRKNNDNILETVNLELIPHTWSGRGILGCKLNLI